MGKPPADATLQRELLGFSREDWALAHARDPAGASTHLVFFDAATGADGQGGGLVGIGINGLIALASVSPVFARRVASGLAKMDPDWRARAESLAAWTSLLSMIDAAGE